MIIAISVIACLAMVCIFMGLTLPMIGMHGRMKTEITEQNALTDSPVGGLITFVARFNKGDGLARTRHVIEQRLLHAGKPGGNIKGEQYLAVAELSGIAAFLSVLLLAILIGINWAIGIGVGIVLALVVVWLVLGYLDNIVTDRRTQISRRFPYFLDLAVMVMEAGSSFLEAAQIYVRDNPHEDPVSEELRIVLGEISMGKTMQEALENLNERVTAEEVQHVVKALLQGQQMGTPLGEVIREQASALRFKRSQMAERAAEELKVKITGPVTLMMISIFLLILGPAVVQIGSSGIF